MLTALRTVTTRRGRRPLHHRSCLVGLLLAVTTSQTIAVSDASAGFGAPTVTPRHHRIADAVVRLIDRHGRSGIRFKDEIGTRLLDRYLDAWDPERLFLLLADIREFEHRRSALSDAIRNGDLGFAFEIFDRVRARVEEYTAFAIRALDEALGSERVPVPVAEPGSREWAEDETVLRGRWRRRVSDEIAELLANGVYPVELQPMLRARYATLRQRVRRTGADNVVERVLDAYVAAVDRHGAYLSPRALARLHVRAQGALAGIGVVLRSEGAHAVVDRIVRGGPAERSRALEIGDRIIGIGPTGEPRLADVTGWPVADVAERLRGPAGTPVRLRILPAGIGAAARTITLIRDEVALEGRVATGRLLGIVESNCRGPRIGVVSVPSFYSGRAAGQRRSGASGDVRRIIHALRTQGMNALVLDLRRNGGGSLEQAVRTAGLFIAGGPIVQVRSHAGGIGIRKDPSPEVEWEGALVVLVGSTTASAAEIVAAAIQDRGRGVVAGERTLGKGSAQRIFPIDEIRGGGALRLTTSRWFRVTGETIEQLGVYPDVDLARAAGSERPVAPESAVHEARSRVPAVVFEPGALTGGVVVSLRRRSRERLAANQGFLALRDRPATRARHRTGARASLAPEQIRDPGGRSALRRRLVLEEAVRIASDLAHARTAKRGDITGEMGEPGGRGTVRCRDSDRGA